MDAVGAGDRNRLITDDPDDGAAIRHEVVAANQDRLIRRVDVLGVHISAIDMAMALDEIERWITAREQHYVCVTGVHGVMGSQRDADLRAIHNASVMTTPDGMPMVWAGRRAGAAWMTRVS